MTAPTTAPQDLMPPGPPPPMPDAPPPLAPEVAGPTPTLSDVALSGPAKPTETETEPDAPPMTPEQIIGVVAEFSAFGLPGGLADAYKDDFKSNPIVQLGVQMSGLTNALAAYGMTAGGGKMPEWLSVALGVAVLGYGIQTTRSKYVPHQLQGDPAGEAAEAAGGGFAGAGLGTPLQTTNIGFSGTGTGGSGD
ncbi:hypothetical protein IHN32_02110 [Deinococcus sp. 14RED07]|uniref:hypothetical protein n=1 Tax=Deinococcus sp. 14RED07 TaxID=2745874 RepID=UPI001E29CB3D|nr:hypothetical protein [Deinococcus sp. 14RED07]MCD0174748.1 hypothetical protein [Deinococcus sp. 14RED07]